VKPEPKAAEPEPEPQLVGAADSLQLFLPTSAATSC
jgi:hypothetical protein